MSKNDEWIMGLLITSVLIYTVLFIAGIHLHKLLLFIAIANAATALFIIVWRVQRFIVVKTHYFDIAEIAGFIFEVLLIAYSIYIIKSNNSKPAFRVIQFTCFGFHATAILFLIAFMSLFKITRLI